MKITFPQMVSERERWGEAVAAHDSGKILCLSKFNVLFHEVKLKVSLPLTLRFRGEILLAPTSNHLYYLN